MEGPITFYSEKREKRGTGYGGVVNKKSIRITLLDTIILLLVLTIIFPFALKYSQKKVDNSFLYKGYKFELESYSYEEGTSLALYIKREESLPAELSLALEFSLDEEPFFKKEVTLPALREETIIRTSVPQKKFDLLCRIESLDGQLIGELKLRQDDQ